MKLIALFAVLVSCGAQPLAELDVPKLESGRYLSDGYVIEGSAEGKCAWLGTEFHSYTNVDDAGQIESPLRGTINCQTTYDVDGFAVSCGSTLGAELEAHGELYGHKAVGIADAHGDIGGCKRLLVGFYLELDPVQP